MTVNTDMLHVQFPLMYSLSIRSLTSIDKKRPSEEFASRCGVLHTILGLCSTICSVSVFFLQISVYFVCTHSMEFSMVSLFFKGVVMCVVPPYP